MPFDWLITGDFQSVLSLIDNGFEGFLEKENLYQEFQVNPSYYYNEVSDVHFYHDFSPYISLDEQYKDFQSKYLRRIKRFYEVIERPTVFIRYCSCYDELKYIAENQSQIISLLRKFNPNNDIIYITSATTDLKIDNLFSVKNDRNDGVSRKFIKQLPKLHIDLLYRCDPNIDIQKNKRKHLKNEVKKFFRKSVSKITTRLKKRKIYRHYKCCGEQRRRNDEQQ